jgi:hypothetical protein
MSKDNYEKLDESNKIVFASKCRKYELCAKLQTAKLENVLKETEENLTHVNIKIPKYPLLPCPQISTK